VLTDVLRSNKNEPRYLGPYTIVRVSPLGTYTLRDQAGGIFHRDVARDALKVVRSTSFTADQDTTFYVDKILDTRLVNGQRE